VSNQQLAHLICNQRKGVKTMRQLQAVQPLLRRPRKRLRRSQFHQILHAGPVR
jgi:hypothetical protein